MVIALVALSLIRRGSVVKRSDFPPGMPLLFLPLVYCVLVLRHEWRLWKRQRIRAFLDLANDLRMRKQRIHRLLPFITRR